MTKISFEDLCTDAEGAPLIGESLDNYRQLARKPDFPKAFKFAGRINLRKRAELLAYKRKRDAARKAK